MLSIFTSLIKNLNFKGNADCYMGNFVPFSPLKKRVFPVLLLRVTPAKFGSKFNKTHLNQLIKFIRNDRIFPTSVLTGCNSVKHWPSMIPLP